MNIQYISDDAGSLTGVFIPIDEWNELKERFKDIRDIESDLPKQLGCHVKSYENNSEQVRDFNTTIFIMINEPKAYFTGIENKLIEYINKANFSIKIAVAWFTSKEIKESILNKKKNNIDVSIEIVVDDNGTNEKYFFDYREKFESVGIILKEKVKRKFLHNKFIVIDDEILITGSYNFSRNAKSNFENIVIIDSARVSKNYSRIFEFLTDEEYIDENILLLQKYPKFAQKILSTYYKFTKKEYLKYKNKIKWGNCFTHFDGYIDEISYDAGFIFNPKVSFEKKIKNEFDLPIQKNLIENWKFQENAKFNYQLYKEQLRDNSTSNDEYWNEFEDDTNNLLKNIQEFFTRKLDNTFNADELEDLINKNVDIIIEDGIWEHNFEPFLNRKIVENLFKEFDSIERKKDFWGGYYEVIE